VVQTVLKKAKKGTNGLFVPGNHDEVIRQFIDLDFGASRSVTSWCTSPPMAVACWCCTVTASTASSPAPSGWPTWATRSTP
jgi:hypothetical protein